jgi:hypothetical protein
MLRRIPLVSALVFVAASWIVYSAFGQQPAAQGQAKEGKGKGKGKQVAQRPPLFLREEWKQSTPPSEHGATQESIANSNIELKLYGPSAKEVQLTGNVGDENNPVHVWTGLCPSACAVTLRDKTNYADMTGLARIKWVTKMSGFHQVRPVVKLADGTLLVGDHAEGSTADWLTSEFTIADLKWRRLDPERAVTVGDWVNNPDLSKVDEIGFADLMPGSGHGQGGWSDVGLIEVYAKPVAR